MKKFLLFELLLMVVIFSGCGNRYSDETFLRENASWVENKDYIDDFMDAAGLDDNGVYDEEFLTQQLLDGKIQYTNKKIKVAVTDELKNGKIVEIKILQGRYKNKIGYTFPAFIIDAGKEKEIKKKQDEERRVKEAKQLEKQLEEQAKREQKEKALLEELHVAGDDGVQIVIALGDGTNAYQKLLGKTNLPEGTRLSVTLAGVKKETVVQNDGTFAALFERAIIPVGGQSILITTLDGKQIYSGTRQVK